jgi:hypothetical protein
MPPILPAHAHGADGRRHDRSNCASKRRRAAAPAGGRGRRIRGRQQRHLQRTLISPRIFLTAGHCADFLHSLNQTTTWITFKPE